MLHSFPILSLGWWFCQWSLKVMVKREKIWSGSLRDMCKATWLPSEKHDEAPDCVIPSPLDVLPLTGHTGVCEFTDVPPERGCLGKSSNECYIVWISKKLKWATNVIDYDFVSTLWLCACLFCDHILLGNTGNKITACGYYWGSIFFPPEIQVPLGCLLI